MEASERLSRRCCGRDYIPVAEWCEDATPFAVFKAWATTTAGRVATTVKFRAKNKGRPKAAQIFLTAES